MYVKQKARMKEKSENKIKNSKRGRIQDRKISNPAVLDILQRGDNNEDFNDIYNKKEPNGGSSDEGEIYDEIKVQKELIERVKYQPWSMAKKIKLIGLAKAFVEKHEGNLSRSHGYHEKGLQVLRQMKRNITNLVSMLTPWEMRIKAIESHFGSVVASYFVFLRWLMWINAWLTVFPLCFVILPELIVGDAHGTVSRKMVPEGEKETASDLKTIWNADGILKYSVIFYGYYGNKYTIGNGYRLPLAYLLTGIAAFAFSFIILLRRMAANARLNRLSEKEEEYTFSWKLFGSWDYTIGNSETANTKYASNVTTFKETILEAKHKEQPESRKILIICRIIANILVLLLLALSTYIIQLCVERSREMEIQKRKHEISPNFWDENELTIVMTLIATIFPNFFDLISLMEKYHPRINLRWQLARIFALNLLNLYTLFIALFWKQQDLKQEIQAVLHNVTVASQCLMHHNITETSGTSTVHTTIGNNRVTEAFELQNCTTLSVNNSSTVISGLCWETMVGQEIFKLTIMDLVFTLGTIFIQDFLRGLFVRYCNTLCCWDLQKTFPEYGDFKTAENLLHLINNQGMIWLGSFFAPGLPVLNLLKLLVLVYIRCWSVMVCNVPQEAIFRASRSNNFYYALLLIMLFLCMLPPLFAIVTMEPSPDCGPFSGQERMFKILTATIENELPSAVSSVLEYVASPGVIIPVFMLLGMVIYYLLSVGRALRDANNELRTRLEYERTEGKRKIYAMADAKRQMENNSEDGGGKRGMKSITSSVMAAARFAKMLSNKTAKKPVKQSVTKQLQHNTNTETVKQSAPVGIVKAKPQLWKSISADINRIPTPVPTTRVTEGSYDIDASPSGQNNQMSVLNEQDISRVASNVTSNSVDETTSTSQKHISQMSVINEQKRSNVIGNITSDHIDQTRSRSHHGNSQMSVINERKRSSVTSHVTRDSIDQTNFSSNDVISNQDNIRVEINSTDTGNDRVTSNNDAVTQQEYQENKNTHFLTVTNADSEENGENERKNIDLKRETNSNETNDFDSLSVIQKYKISLQKRRRSERHSPSTERKHNCNTADVMDVHNDIRENLTI